MIDKIKRITFLRRLLIYIMKFVSIINRYTPKDEYKILFYDSGWNGLQDNAEAFYSWLKSNKYDQKYKLIVCVPNEKQENCQLGYKPIGALRGVIEYLSSKYVFFSYGDFRIKPSQNQIVVNLWHGTPLKKIGKLTKDEIFKNERIDTFSFLLASSELFVPIMAKAFGCTEDKVKVFGHTRNDYLFSKNDALTKVGIDRKRFDKFILWMPTFRQSKDNRFSDSDILNTETMLPILDNYQKLREMDVILKRLNNLLVIKIHPYAKFKDIQLSNILMMKNDDILPKGVKLYEFVKDFDALITDYSSIYFDYMLLDRPIAFTLDDYQSYADNRGFVFENAKEYMPGSHIYNFKDMEQFVGEVTKGIDNYKQKRNQLMPEVCKYTDGNNCKRLAEKLAIK